MKALILAAGQGKRMKASLPKALVKLRGLTLLQRSIASLEKLDISEFVIVIGFQRKKVKQSLCQENRRIIWVENKAYEKGNALSVYCAREYLKECFLVAMVDHIFDPLVFKNLPSQPKNPVIGVDSCPKFVDCSEATKVLVHNSRVLSLGKNIQDYNALDCGLSLCSPKIFALLAEEIEKGNEEWDDAKRRLISEFPVYAYDVRGGFWFDIDTPEDLSRAEKLLEEEIDEGYNPG